MLPSLFRVQVRTVPTGRKKHIEAEDTRYVHEASKQLDDSKKWWCSEHLYTYIVHTHILKRKRSVCRKSLYKYLRGIYFWFCENNWTYRTLFPDLTFTSLIFFPSFSFLNVFNAKRTETVSSSDERKRIIAKHMHTLFNNPSN